MPLALTTIKRTEPGILRNMAVHYSNPRGFVGRNICYAVEFDGVRYGSIVGGSATLHLPGRNEFFGVDKSNLGGICNNIFYHIEKQNERYPARNFGVLVLQEFTLKIKQDWKEKYGDDLIGFESLVELPRSGEVYKRNGWSMVGQTTGFTCKRIAGKGTDNWTGKRVWNTNRDELRPKLVFCKKA